MLHSRPEDLLDFCFLASEGLPGRAPLCLNTVYQILTAPSLFTSPPSPCPPRVCLYHRQSGKNLLCSQTVNISALLMRLHSRLILGMGAIPFNPLLLGPCPVFCTGCATLLKDKQCLLRHLYNDNLDFNQTDHCRAMQATTRRLSHAVSSCPSHDAALLALQNPALFSAPITPEIWLQEAGDFVHWVNCHLHCSEFLQVCPICSFVFRDQAEIAAHLHKQRGWGREHITDPFEDLQYCPRSATAHLQGASYSGPAFRLDRASHLVRLTGAIVSKLIPGKAKHSDEPTFMRLLSWANLCRGSLLAHYTHSFGRCRFLLIAAGRVSPELLLAAAGVLSSHLSHNWLPSCHDVLAAYQTPAIADEAVTDHDILGLRSVQSPAGNPPH